MGPMFITSFDTLTYPYVLVFLRGVTPARTTCHLPGPLYKYIGTTLV